MGTKLLQTRGIAIPVAEAVGDGGIGGGRWSMVWESERYGHEKSRNKFPWSGEEIVRRAKSVFLSEKKRGYGSLLFYP